MNKFIKFIKSFFRGFRKKEVLLIEEKDEQNVIKEGKKVSFKEKINIDDSSNVIQLQLEYEKGNIDESELNLLQIEDLINLYRSQIKKLDEDIELKNEKLKELKA